MNQNFIYFNIFQQEMPESVDEIVDLEMIEKSLIDPEVHEQLRAKYGPTDAEIQKLGPTYLESAEDGQYRSEAIFNSW